MSSHRQQFQAFLDEVAKSGRFLKAKIEPPEPGENIAMISGEVSSHREREEIIEIARQHGFLLLAQELFIPYSPEE
jgi:hypothetical protein